MKEWTEFITNEMLEYLDALRDSGITNMLGAGPYVETEFGLTPDEAKKLLVNWTETHSARHA